MVKRKKIKKSNTGGDLAAEIKGLVSGLYYLSETDSEIFLFAGGKAEAVTREIILSQTKSANDLPVEEREFEEFFSRLTKIEDWFGDEEKETAEKFMALKELLKKKLKKLKVFKIGSIELDIYVVGLDSEGFLTGINTKAVET